MKLLPSFVVVLSLIAFSETGATDFASLSTPQVEALLTSQAHNEWGDELLKAFPAGAETDDWSDLPITLFPALRNTGRSSQLRLTSHLQSDVDLLLHEGPPQEGPRTRLARGVLNVLQSTAAEPKRLFGVSVVDAYESMLQLRRTAKDVEQSIVAAGLGKSR